MSGVDPYLAISVNPQFLAYGVLVTLLEDYAKRVAVLSDVGTRDALDQAIREIALPTTTDLIAIKHLIRLGFGSTAETMLRTQIERIATIAFLRKNPTKIAKWVKVGGDVETLKKRIDYMDDLLNPTDGSLALSRAEFTEQLKQYVDGLQSLVHCNRAGAYNSAVEQDDTTHLVAGSNPYSPNQISRVSNYAGHVLSYLLQELNLQYPTLRQHYLGVAA